MSGAWANFNNFWALKIRFNQILSNIENISQILYYIYV